MRAPDFETIYNLKPVIEECFADAFGAKGFATFTRLNAIDFQKTRPRLEFVAVIGGQNNHMALCPDFQERRDQWSFHIEVQAITEPSNVPEEDNIHPLYVASVRAFASTLAQSSWKDPDNFPYHAITEALKESGTTDYLKSDEGYEYSVIGFDGWFGVRKDAWPLPV